MRTVDRHIHPVGGLALLVMALVVILSGCRRELWIYTDEFRQIALLTDWSLAHEHPSGMTWWFMSDDNSGRNRYGTTAEVTRTAINLPRGRFSGVVFDYSPSEYSHQEFIGMTQPDSALVHIKPSADQPRPDDHLFGALAVPSFIQGIPVNPDNNGMYLLSAEPEPLNVDTIKNVTVTTGIEEDRILYKDRDRYANTVIEQTLYAQPKPVVWKLYIRVAVKGMTYMNSVRATVAGLADGCWLSTLRHTSTPCLQLLDNWQTTSYDGVGTIVTSINTFGLPDLDMPMSPTDARSSSTRASSALSSSTPSSSSSTSVPSSSSSVPSSSSSSVPSVAMSSQPTPPFRANTHIGLDEPEYKKRLQLNLQFLLRDETTVLNYHYDLDHACITILEDELRVNVDIPIDYPGGIPDLPFVDAKGTTGFDATVTPWADGCSADTTM